MQTLINLETGDIQEIELTAQEIAERAELHAQAEARQAEQEAKASARESALAKLADLGLTAEEIAAL
jgi:hypothetical protein